MHYPGLTRLRKLELMQSFALPTAGRFSPKQAEVVNALREDCGLRPFKGMPIVDVVDLIFTEIDKELQAAKSQETW